MRRSNQIRASLDGERFDVMCGSSYRSPEERLALAVFERALRDYIGNKCTAKRGGVVYDGITRVDKATAEAYLFDPTFYQGPYTVELAAEILGWDPDALRSWCKKAFKKWNGSEYRPKCRRR